jgi:signal transduction histidine kinase
MAELLSITVSAAADAAAQEAVRAADLMAHATAAAAEHVTLTVAAAEEVAESEVTASADAQRELSTAAAAAVAVQTNARAAGAAREAREAARALIGYEQGVRTVEPATNPAKRHPAPHAAPDRLQTAEELLAAADARDTRAGIRDMAADDRQREASFSYFLLGQDSHEYEHDADFPARRAAAMDRLDSLADRVSAASDRAWLSDQALRASLSKDAGWGPVPAAQLSHDLRVPLTSIMSNVEVLQVELEDHPNRVVGELCDRVMRAGDRMARMLDHLVASQAGPGTQAAVPEVDLAEIAQQVVRDSADLLGPSGAVVAIGELPYLQADPDDMYAVLQNLINNSVKFARPGVPARVRISARPTIDGWRVSVRDYGTGLGNDGGPGIFTMSSRGTSTVAGHGIGLATVARIIADHGGRVGVAPAVVGAEIWFELPLFKAVR